MKSGLPPLGLTFLVALAASSARAEGEQATYVERGELTEAGRTSLRPIGPWTALVVGTQSIGRVHYLGVTPELHSRWRAVSFGLALPLRVQLLDTTALDVLNEATYPTVLEGALRFRQQDWDEVGDVLRPLRYVTLGGKEESFFLDVSRDRAITLGHGQLVRRYVPNLDGEQRHLFGSLDARTRFLGVESFAGPLPVPRVLGALVFAKPLWFHANEVARSLSVGVTVASDLNVPLRLARRRSPADDRSQLAFDEDGLVWDRRSELFGRPVVGIGLDVEAKPLRREHVELKVYQDTSQLLLPQPGSTALVPSDPGFALGALLRASSGVAGGPSHVSRTLLSGHVIRARAELRTFGPTFLPSYFDSLYEVDRLQLALDDTPLSRRAERSPKAAVLRSRAGGPWRVGWYLEAAWRWRDVVSVLASYADAVTATEGAPAPLSRTLVVHAETGRRPVQLFVTYHARHLPEWHRTLTMTTNNELLFAGTRIALGEHVVLRLALRRAYTVVPHEDDFGPKVPLPGGAGPPYRYTTLGYDVDWAARAELEIGMPP